MSTAAPLSIFISYSKTDTEFVKRLEADLKAHGFATWVDHSELQGGQQWLDEIQTAVDRSQVVVLVLSPDALLSSWVRKEYRYALTSGRRLIPILYRPCGELPLELGDIQYVDFQADYATCFQNLLTALATKPSPPPVRRPNAIPNPRRRVALAGGISIAVVVSMIGGLLLAQRLTGGLGAASGCAQINGFRSVTTASAGPAFPDVTFPAQSVTTTGTHSTDVYGFQVINVCTANPNRDAVNAFFASSLPSKGWSAITTFPVGGDPTHACDGVSCWRKASPGARYVSLANMSVSSTTTTYTLTLATAPAPATKVIVRTGQQQIAAGGSGTATASCLPGEQMLSGGFSSQVNDTNLLTPADNYPSDPNTWSVTYRNGGQYTAVAQAYVVCLQANYKVGITIKSAVPQNFPPELDCPQGSVATGGGFKFSNQVTGNTFTSMPAASGNGWVIGIVPDPHVYLNETLYVVCASRNLTVAAPMSVNLPVAHQQTNSANATCGANQILTGGGYEHGQAQSPLYFAGFYEDYPVGTGDATNIVSWKVSVSNQTSYDYTMKAYAVCAIPAPVF